jgi:hypothetical protein
VVFLLDVHAPHIVLRAARVFSAVSIAVYIE